LPNSSFHPDLENSLRAPPLRRFLSGVMIPRLAERFLEIRDGPAGRLGDQMYEACGVGDGSQGDREKKGAT
jgi:hypothetical protein